ncbi:hypothetical protein V492_05868 [Pseudogymnoascus sp. VKM F-4246]|nr:hypothetical protein V492_05868 [Pseudogymnoascus sp. VKM F-4246]
MKLPTFLAFLPIASGQMIGNSVYKKRLTGADLDTSQRWSVAGTDLGIPYVLENGAIGYLFGDTFNTAWPEQQNNDWRAPVMLRSAIHPGDPNGIVFDSAAGVAGDGNAPEIMHNGHRGDDGSGTFEISVIPNDGIGFPETGDQIVSYMSIKDWAEPWKTNYAGLAISNNGNSFTRLDVTWRNNDANDDPFQMWTMERDGDWVYIFSVRSGRQPGPMMLQRVPWDQMVNKAAYQGWGSDGSSWDWNRPCTPILQGNFGEPSVRKLADGTWAMTYLNLDTLNIVSRTAKGPNQVWSAETVQVYFAQEPSLYGGFIHPWSTSSPNDLHLMVSKWTHDKITGASTAYHVSQYVGSL